MRKGTVVSGVVVGLMAAGALVWWWRDTANTSSRQDLGGEAPRATQATPAPSVANLGTAQAPLPDDGTPLRLVYDSLRQRAASGDARAACRLAAELEQCERVRNELAQFGERLSFQQDQLAREPDPAQRARLEGMDRGMSERGQDLLQASEQCDGVPYVSPAERASLWRSAALGGSLPALTQYAVGNAFRTRDTLQLLPQLQIYRNEAESLALQAAQRGSIKAILALAAAYSPARDTGRRTYLAQVVQADAATSLALYLQAQRALSGDAGMAGAAPMGQDRFNRSIDALRKGMSADQIAQAQAQAARWQQNWAAPDAATGGFSPDGGTTDIAPQACAK